MGTNYVILLDYYDGEIIKIRLSDEEKQKADEFDNFEDFLHSIEDKYGFNLDDCCWATADNLKERNYI